MCVPIQHCLHLCTHILSFPESFLPLRSKKVRLHSEAPGATVEGEFLLFESPPFVNGHAKASTILSTFSAKEQTI